MAKNNLEVVAREFADDVRLFCSVIDSTPTTERSMFLHELHRTLARLYASAIDLPLVEPETDQAAEDSLSDEASATLAARLASYLSDVDEYWEVFDPYEESDPLPGRLSDDLTDIYRDACVISPPAS